MHKTLEIKKTNIDGKISFSIKKEDVKATLEDGFNHKQISKYKTPDYSKYEAKVNP